MNRKGDMEMLFTAKFWILVIGLLLLGNLTNVIANDLPPTVTILSPNAAGGTMTVKSGTSILFEAAATDQDYNGSRTVTFYWKIDGSIKETYYYKDNTVFDYTFNLANDELERTFTMTVTVRDNEGNYKSKSIIVTVVRDEDRHYYLKDHLGSVRTTVAANTQEQLDANEVHVSSWDDYYPFGLPMPGRSENSTNADALNKFTGHEMDTQNDINLTYAGARYLDPEIGRWLSVDPLAGKYPSLSPYVYVAGNPLNAIDPNGKEIITKYLSDGWLKHLESFANTEVGYQMLAKFAKAGDKIGGVTFEKNGRYHQNKIHFVSLGQNVKKIPAAQYLSKRAKSIYGITDRRGIFHRGGSIAGGVVADKYLYSASRLDGVILFNSLDGMNSDLSLANLVKLVGHEFILHLASNFSEFAELILNNAGNPEGLREAFAKIREHSGADDGGKYDHERATENEHWRSFINELVNRFGDEAVSPYSTVNDQ